MLATMPRYTPPPNAATFRAQEPHEWIKEVRVDKKLRQDEIEAFTSKLGPKARISQPHLSRIERGYSPLEELGPIRMDALRQALGVSAEEWATHTGLTIISPNEEPNVDLPPALLEASQKFGGEFPDLADQAWLQLMHSASPHDWDGPETPQEWLALYMSLRNHTKPKRR